MSLKNINSIINMSILIWRESINPIIEIDAFASKAISVLKIMEPFFGVEMVAALDSQHLAAEFIGRFEKDSLH